jgi:hypothetical protein
MSKFGDFVTTQRLSLNLSLRTFCDLHHEDLLEWSKLERAVILPPKSTKRLIEMADKLSLSDRDEFIALAQSAELSTKKPAVPAIPFGSKLSEKKLASLFKLIQKETTPRRRRMK